MLGEGGEEAGALLQERPNIIQDKEPLFFAFFFPCSPFSTLPLAHLPFHLYPPYCFLL